ncbi:MAG: DUF4293 domain-containing protein [Bacteroidales bacterium]
MIQRIQSLYLFLAFVACLLTFFFPFADFVLNSEQGYFLFSLMGLIDSGPDRLQVFNWLFSLPLWSLNSFVGLMSLFIVFQYKNRVRQLKLLRINVFVNIILIGFIFYYAASLIENKLGMTPHYRAGIYFPLASIILQILATRAIRNDEKLVRSADRLR